MDVSQYLEIFIDETNEHLQNLSDCIMTLEKEPDNKDTINEVFRAAHSLKGMAGTMGFKRMQHLTHDMEDVFQEVRSDKIRVNSKMIDILFECLDALDKYLENVKETSDEGTEDNEAIIKELNDFIAQSEGKETASSVEATEIKETPMQEEDGSTKKFMEIELTNSEKEAVKNAEGSGKHVYGFTVYIHQDCLLKAARAFLVFKAVEDFGEIIVYRPSSQDIEDEKFELDFSFFLASEEALDKIIAAAKAVSEIDTVLAEEVKSDILEKKEEMALAAEKLAAVQETAEAKPAAVEDTAKKTQSAAAKKTTSNKPVTSRTVRVDIEKLDALMNQVSELIIAKNSLVSISTTEGGNFEP